MIMIIKFENEMLQEKIKLLISESSNTTLIEKVLDSIVDDIFTKYSFSGHVLTYEEWEKWLKSSSLLEKIMNFVGAISN